MSFWLKGLMWSLLMLLLFVGIVAAPGVVDGLIGTSAPSTAASQDPSLTAGPDGSPSPSPPASANGQVSEAELRQARDGLVTAPLNSDLSSTFGIGPSTVAEQIDMLKKPRTDLGWADYWAMTFAPDFNVTKAGISVNSMTGELRPFLRRPSYLVNLTQIKNDSNRTLTFDLADCDVKSTTNATGSGPVLLVSGPPPSNYNGYSYKDATDDGGPFAMLPSCDNQLNVWPGPITVPAGQTWKAAPGPNYLLTFELPAGSTPEKYRVTGFLLKARDGSVAYADVNGFPASALYLP